MITKLRRNTGLGCSQGHKCMKKIRGHLRHHPNLIFIFKISENFQPNYLNQLLKFRLEEKKLKIN